ncbi:PD-(D/E)XK motif protein [Sphingobium xanthum]|uniref:PD-(D/E)XK motif protein n=1 Tax=Sphingobium xanthum TaxID=1387165 RepID=UPI001C8B0D89|nr:PD-(D/E)XK motif protein [Sphingobium xanthum]
MTISNSPWDDLVPGVIDARRVDSAGKWDFFWWISDRAEPALILRLSAGSTEIAPLPKMRSLDIRYRDVPGGRALVILLREPEQQELFETLCKDVVKAGEAASSADDAHARSTRRTLRWHHLLRGGRFDLLSIEEQRGLVGELHFLSHLCDLIGPRAAIEAWKGPEGSAKDFEIDRCLVEIKARRGAARPHVQISSEDQLADVVGTRLFLNVYDVDAAIKPAGMTLTDHVRAAEARFSDADMTAFGMWEAAIEAAGFDFEDDYSERRWTIGRIQQFEVVDAFPRVAVPLPSGVGSVRYSIALDACQPFRVEAAVLDTVIRGD